MISVTYLLAHREGHLLEDHHLDPHLDLYFRLHDRLHDYLSPCVRYLSIINRPPDTLPPPELIVLQKCCEGLTLLARSELSARYFRGAAFGTDVTQTEVNSQ